MRRGEDPAGSDLLRLYGRPPGSRPEVSVIAVPKHGSWQWHELEIGSHLQQDQHIPCDEAAECSQLCLQVPIKREA